MTAPQDQPRLWRGPVVALTVNAGWSFSGAWSVVLNARHEGEDWSEATQEIYGPLSTDELVDVLQAVLDAVLRGSTGAEI